MIGIENAEKQSGVNQGVAYVQTTDVHTATQLIKLHYNIFAGYKLRTYLMGYPYESFEEDEEENNKNERRHFLMQLEELRYKSIVQQKVRAIKEKSKVS
mmetsp:Transcript_11810/g.19955  ORF Transcript_11810/g.19955 Transcript_11810/m.19955 type:complete len:99 (+) Transcript_11810:529-825(+)